MYNKLIMVGNLTRDIELKYLPNGTTIAAGAIATSHKYKMASGEQKEEVCFLDFSVFGKSATILNQYVRKGSKVLLEGRLKLDQWQDQNTGTRRSKHSLMVDTFKFLDSKADTANLPPQGNGSYGQQPSYNQPSIEQPKYNAPEQNNYGQQQPYNNNQEQNGYGQQSQSGMQQQQEQHQPDPYVEKIPEIDIDNDEIPF